MAETKKVVDQSPEEQTLSKKELKKLEKQRKKENKKKGGFVKLVLVFIILLGALFAFLYFDVFSIRSTYVDPRIEGTPIAQIFNSSSQTTGEPQMSRADLLLEVERLNAEVESLNAELTEANEKNDLYVGQLEQLMPLEEQQVQFKADKEAFDKMIAENDPNAFQAFYESVYPETAQEVYNNIVSDDMNSKELSDYVSKFTAMDEDKAAGILEVMSDTDLDLVVSILNSMSSDKSGGILAAMTPETAATIAKRMAPSI